MKRAFIIIPLLLALIAFGIPYATIGDQVSQYQGNEALFAKYALHQADLHDQFGLRYQVARLNQVAYDGICDDSSIEGSYLAIIQSYTVFGIPLAQYEVTCAGSTKVN